ncbi:hypothetical protein [Streptomyces sp. NBC_01236]|uniref:hypothetical protein n=1 Tax=Streptomyces sp. NBC_01236 TaxID=2903789 RepID=UPI002E135B01|nr:hypothetical protein OG324_21410 [Streptomyces sp. NBC_01236]
MAEYVQKYGQKADEATAASAASRIARIFAMASAGSCSEALRLLRVRRGLEEVLGEGRDPARRDPRDRCPQRAQLAFADGAWAQFVTFAAEV